MQVLLYSTDNVHQFRRCAVMRSKAVQGLLTKELRLMSKPHGNAISIVSHLQHAWCMHVALGVLTRRIFSLFLNSRQLFYLMAYFKVPMI